MIAFTVNGECRPAGSKRAFVLRRRDGSLVTRTNGAPIVNVTDDNAKSKGWKQTIGWAAREAAKDAPLLRGPLEVEFTFYRPRPNGHNGKRGLTKSGRETPFPISRPDALKLARAAEDALSGVLWNDDAQIVTETLRKRWGEPARVEVMVKEAQ